MNGEKWPHSRGHGRCLYSLHGSYGIGTFLPKKMSVAGVMIKIHWVESPNQHGPCCNVLKRPVHRVKDNIKNVMGFWRICLQVLGVGFLLIKYTLDSCKWWRFLSWQFWPEHGTQMKRPHQANYSQRQSVGHSGIRSGCFWWGPLEFPGKFPNSICGCEASEKLPWKKIWL